MLHRKEKNMTETSTTKWSASPCYAHIYIYVAGI